MKKRLLLFVLLSLLCHVGFAQSVILTFTARDANGGYVQLDSVQVRNFNCNWVETLHYPDTILMMGQVGIEDYESDYPFALQQNNPNPFAGTTYVTLQTVESGEVSLTLTDMNGRILETCPATPVQSGVHRFRIDVTDAGTYLLTARQNGKTSSVKMVNTSRGGKNLITYQTMLSKLRKPTGQTASQTKGHLDRTFYIGNEMSYAGYTTVEGEKFQSVIIKQKQMNSEDFILNFSTINNNDAKPCPNSPILTDYDGNIYNTVQIGTQCWMKENLKTTHYSDGTGILLGDHAVSDTMAYFYYPNNDSSNVAFYGLYYNWPALMNKAVSSFTIPSGVQGICPTGWHVPSDREWTVLEDYVGSQSKYICGNDPKKIAKALASTEGWVEEEFPFDCSIATEIKSNNATGFSVLPAGNFEIGSYNYLGECADFWTATNMIDRFMVAEAGEVGPNPNAKNAAFSVRCLRD